jgi:hypothetical protein
MSTARFHEGDKSKAICSHCGKVVDTTFVRRDVLFSDGKGIAKEILAAACDVCGQVVAISADYTPAIRVVRR